MTTDYDPIAEQYARAKHQPWRNCLECFTMMELIGDVKGLRVLDLACGDGFYARLLKRNGADRMVGVDLSESMIDLAKSQERSNSLGIDYFVGDARELPDFGKFDLVIAAYLLNYARNREEMQGMCSGIARSLRPDGRFVTANTDPSFDFTRAPSYRKYGFETSVQEPWGEGSPITYTFYLEDGPFSIENYHLSKNTHDQALAQAGFRGVRWHPPRLSPEAPMREIDGFWDDLVQSSPVVFLECVAGDATEPGNSS